ncbi:MAG: DNA-binding NarL/FixJ family response regulator [Pirellulaceae bacterium]|jgi:DNA-binding NarL/FixJ family response regulator
MVGFTLRVLLIGEFSELSQFSELALHQPLTAITIHSEADASIVDSLDSSQYDVIAVVVKDPIEDSLELIAAISDRVETPLMGIHQTADESIEDSLYSAGCRHCFIVDPWNPQEFAVAIHNTARRDPLLCELLGVPHCEVNWQLSFFGSLLESVESEGGDARAFLDGQLPLHLAEAVRETTTNPRYDIQREALVQRFAFLTNKEIRVLLHVLQGKSSSQIAADTGVSDNTIRSQRIAALRKLGANTPIELATALVTVGIQAYLKQLAERKESEELKELQEPQKPAVRNVNRKRRKSADQDDEYEVVNPQ